MAVDYVIKNGDVLTHKVVRKELPVYKGPLPKIFESDQLLVVNKPPSMPVHSCGGYFHNTVLGLIEHEFGCYPLFRGLTSDPPTGQTDLGSPNCGQNPGRVRPTP